MSTEEEDNLMRKYRNKGMTWRAAIRKVDEIKMQEDFRLLH